MGNIVGGLLSGIGSLKAANTASSAQEQQAAALQDAVETINAVGAGPDLAKEIIFDKFQSAGILTPELEQQINAQFEQIAPASKVSTDAQKQALQKFTNLSETGLDAQDRLALNKLQTQTARDATAKQNDIIQNLAARGQAGGGAELAARLSASQNASNAENEQGLQIAAQAQARALQALTGMSNEAGQMRGQDFSENQANTGIKNEQQRFNVSNQVAQQQRNVGAKNSAQQYNLQNNQNIMNANTQMSNAEKLRQREAEQQMYQNKMNAAKAAANVRIGQGNAQLDAGYNNAGMQAGIGAGAGQIAQGLTNYFQNSGGYGNKTTGEGIGTGTVDNYNPNTAYAGESAGPWAASHGGQVPGKAKLPGDSPENDTVHAKLSPGEIVIPRSLAHSPEKAKKFIDLLHEKEEVEESPDPKMEKRPKNQDPKMEYDPLAPESIIQKLNCGGMAGYSMGGIIGNPAVNLENSPPQGYAFGGEVLPYEDDQAAQQSDLMDFQQANQADLPGNRSQQQPMLPSWIQQYINAKQDARPAPMNTPMAEDTVNQDLLGMVRKQAGVDPTMGAPKPRSQAAPAPEKSPDVPDKAPEIEQPTLDKQSPDYMAQLKAAYDKIKQGNADALINRGTERIAAATGRMKPDYSFAESLEKQAALPVTELEHGVKFQDATQKAELNKQLGDPNSTISKLYQDAILKVSPDLADSIKGASADQLGKIFPQLNSIYKAQVIGDVRKDLAARKGDEKKAGEQDKFVSKSRTEIMKHDANFDKIKGAEELARKIMQEPDNAKAINDLSLLYENTKVVNPGAIVRPGSIKLEQQANGLLGKIKLQLDNLAGHPELLTPEVRKDIYDNIKRVKDIAQGERDAKVKSFLDDAKSRGIAEERFSQIDPYYNANKEEKAVASAGKATFFDPRTSQSKELPNTPENRAWAKAKGFVIQ